jgi:hypothetical protein
MEPILDFDEVQERDCFVAMPPRGDNEGANLGSPIQEEEYQHQRQVCILAREDTLRQQ